MSTNFQQNTPDKAIQHSCGASAERTARESAIPMHCTPFPPPPRPASRLLASPKVTVHTKSTHYKRSRKAPGEKPQAPPAAEFKLAGPTAAAALRSPARRRIRTGASSSPRPHSTSATASGRGARSQEAKYAAQHAREISHSQGSQRRASLGKRPNMRMSQRFARAKRQSGPLKNSAHFGILVNNNAARKPR